MSDRVRSILLGVSFVGLCSCASVAPAPIADNDPKTFVYVATVHYFFPLRMDFQDKTRVDGWNYASSALRAAGIKFSGEGDMGNMSLSVQRSRCRDAVELLKRNARLQDYWIEMAKDYQ